MALTPMKTPGRAAGAPFDEIGIRGSGCTTMAMLRAPEGARYVVPSATRRLFRGLALDVGRKDLEILPVSDLVPERVNGACRPIVVDHACSFLTIEQLDLVDDQNARWRALHGKAS